MASFDPIRTPRMHRAHGCLEHFGLRIGGMTPTAPLGGSQARSFETVEWLTRFWRTNTYGRPLAEKGLTVEHPIRAVSILESGERDFGAAEE